MGLPTHEQFLIPFLLLIWRGKTPPQRIAASVLIPVDTDRVR